jgi:REP element-mobilizing transposase RayT
MRSKQISLLDDKIKKRYNRVSHGGGLYAGKRKLERPLSKKKWIHLVLKSDKARGPLSFKTPINKIAIQGILKAKARKFGVKIADQANVGNHIHLKVKIHSRELFQKFLISVTGLIARTVTGARKGKAFGRFWNELAFTRVLQSYTEELWLNGYFIANRLEANVSRASREQLLREYARWMGEHGPPSRLRTS